MNLIVPDLYLGDWQDARLANLHAVYKDKGTHSQISTLCVIETTGWDRYEGMTYYVPILEHDEESLAIIPPKALISQLDDCCEIIDHHLLNKLPLLVHCWAGVERSPLTLAYWLVKSRRQPNLDEAYKFLKSKRPIVEDRREWLPLSLASSL